MQSVDLAALKLDEMKTFSAPHCTPKLSCVHASGVRRQVSEGSYAGSQATTSISQAVVFLW